ncbi:MAG: winged helix-turn-helix domain-containing protein [Nanoarchaeota archaeon]
MKVLDYLLDLEMDVSVTDICDGTGLSRKTVDSILINLIKSEIVTNTRKVGKTEMYKINTNNKISNKLLEINNIVLKQQESNLALST